MQILKIKIKGKTFQAGKISSFLSKQVMGIQKDALAMMKKVKAMDQDNIDEDQAEELFAFAEGIHDRKVFVICEVYQNQFSAEEVEKEFSNAEIDAELNKISNGINGVITKN
jgi:hypothetical protein